MGASIARSLALWEGLGAGSYTHLGRDPQLHLYYNTPNNRVGYAGGAPYQITYNGQPGTYWVRVYVADSFNSTNLYTLRVNNP